MPGQTYLSEPGGLKVELSLQTFERFKSWEGTFTFWDNNESSGFPPTDTCSPELFLAPEKIRPMPYRPRLHSL